MDSLTFKFFFSKFYIKKITIYLILLSLNSKLVYAATIYPLVRSPYFKGRGSTGIAIAEDEEAIFYNPAGLAQNKSIFNRIILPYAHVEVSKGISSTAKRILGQNQKINEALKSSQGVPHHVETSTVFGAILKKIALTFFASGSTDFLLFKDPEQGAFESLKVGGLFDGGVSFSLASNIKRKNLLVGLTMKHFVRFESKIKVNAAEIQDAQSIQKNKNFSMLGQATAFDLGVMYYNLKKKGYSYGLTIANVGNTSFSSTEEIKNENNSLAPLSPIKQTINFGIAYSRQTGINLFRILADIRDILNTSKTVWTKRLSLGSELSLNKVFGLTGGLHQGYLCSGLYLDFHYTRIDIGSYTEEVGTESGQRADQRFFLKVEFNI